MNKNIASQKITVFAFDYSTGAPKTGDAANLTAYVSKDDGSVTVLGDTSATELDATNAKGSYTFDLTQAETNADKLLFTGKSSTSNVAIIAQTIYTTPPNFSALLTTAMAESYNADGAAPTPAQALFVIMQVLTEFAISSTSYRVNKLDGTTQALVLTLSDATNPTGATRTT